MGQPFKIGYIVHVLRISMLTDLMLFIKVVKHIEILKPVVILWLLVHIYQKTWSIKTGRLLTTAPNYREMYRYLKKIHVIIQENLIFITNVCRKVSLYIDDACPSLHGLASHTESYLKAKSFHFYEYVSNTVYAIVRRVFHWGLSTISVLGSRPL